MGSGNFNNNKNNPNRRPKWRRNRNKKKRRGKGRIPPMSGGNRAPVLSGNRQPIASMRMRMDDYVAPRMDRMLPYSKGNDIERAVARARREASTRTKDTFWTKKLLDAETSHPNRWAHSGFKELYREELGYNEFEYKERKLQGRSPLRGSRDDFDRRNNAKRTRSPPNKARSSRERLSSPHKSSLEAKSKTESKKKVAKSPRRVSRSRSGSRSVSRSPRSRKRSTQKNDSSPSKPLIGGRKSQYLRPPNKRPYPRSLSCSPSTITSRSRSDSGSYTSYSRSSSFTSTSSSSTFTGSSASDRSYRSYSRSSKSWSRSPSVPRRSAKVKRAPLSKPSSTTRVRKDKILLAKKTSSTSHKNFFTPSSSKQKSKQSSSRSALEPPPLNLVHKKPVSPVSAAPIPPSGSNDFYDKELAPNKSPVYVETVDKLPFGSELRRGPESQTFKGNHLSRDVNVNEASMRSEGEQSNTDSSSDDDDVPMKMTLSERFGKLAQLSSQRQEYEGVRMKIVREGGQDKKVYLEGGSRSPSPPGRRRNVAHEKWLREHKAEYDEYEERYGEFRHWDPHRDLPRELPPNWDDVNIRYRYYKESGYFGDRSITMEDYLKWEEWWYRYRDWLEKYGDVQEESIKYRGPYNYEVGRGSARERWIRRDKEDRKRHRF